MKDNVRNFLIEVSKNPELQNELAVNPTKAMASFGIDPENLPKEITALYAAAGLSGALEGAATDSATGAAIGTAVPVVGTAVGTVIGAAAGAIIGALS